MIVIENKSRKSIEDKGKRLAEETRIIMRMHPEHGMVGPLMKAAEEIVYSDTYLLDALLPQAKRIDFFLYSIIANFNHEDIGNKKAKIGSLKCHCFCRWGSVLPDAYRDAIELGRSQADIQDRIKEGVRHEIDRLLFDWVEEANYYSLGATVRDFLAREDAWEHYSQETT